MGFRKIQLECDAKEIVDHLNRNSPPITVTHKILEACKKELRSFEAWQLKAIMREQNRTADSLAKMATGLPKGMHILETPPDEILGLLEDDAAGLPH